MLIGNKLVNLSNVNYVSIEECRNELNIVFNDSSKICIQIKSNVDFYKIIKRINEEL